MTLWRHMADAGTEVDTRDKGKRVKLVALDGTDANFPVKIGDMGKVAFAYKVEGEDWIQCEWDNGEIESVRRKEVSFL